MMTDPGPLLLNLSLLQTFFPEHLQTGINPSWSLTTELTFYALLPVLAVWLVGRSSRRLALALIPPAVLGAAGLAGRAWAEHLYAQTSGLTVVRGRVRRARRGRPVAQPPRHRRHVRGGHGRRGALRLDRARRAAEVDPANRHHDRLGR